jgi:hypothetical protein
VAHDWQPSGWWRVVRDVPHPGHGDIWSESSDEDAERAALDSAPWPARLERHYERTEGQWRPAARVPARGNDG